MAKAFNNSFDPAYGTAMKTPSYKGVVAARPSLPALYVKWLQKSRVIIRWGVLIISLSLISIFIAVAYAVLYSDRLVNLLGAIEVWSTVPGIFAGITACLSWKLGKGSFIVSLHLFIGFVSILFSLAAIVCILIILITYEIPRNVNYADTLLGTGTYIKSNFLSGTLDYSVAIGLHVGIAFMELIKFFVIIYSMVYAKRNAIFHHPKASFQEKYAS